MNKIGNIRSGGQTGVDRAALDFARQQNIPIKGWCPLGGCAEDSQYPPGILSEYPELQETETSEPSERTVKNVEDSDATLIFENNASDGTNLTVESARRMNKNYFIYSGKEDEGALVKWIDCLPYGVDLNIAGPRESESKGAYSDVLRLLNRVIKQ